MAPNGSLPVGPGDPPPLLKRLHKLYRKARKRVLGPIQKPMPMPVAIESKPKAPPASFHEAPSAVADASIGRNAPAASADAPIEPPVPAAAPFSPSLPRAALTGEIRQAATPGSIDAFAVRALQSDKAEGADGEAGEDADLLFPSFELTSRQPLPPPPGVCFMVPADARSLPAVEMLLLSLLDIYPDKASPILIVMETEPDFYQRRRFARISPRIEFVTTPEGWDESYPGIAGETARQRLTLYVLAITDHDRIVVIQPDALVLGDISEAWTGEGLILGYDLSDGGFVPRSTLTGDYLYDIELLSLPASMRGPDAAKAMAVLMQQEGGADKNLDRHPIRRCWNLFARDHEKTVLPIRCSLSAMYVLKCLEGSRQGVCLLHDNGEDPWLPGGGK